MESSVCIVEVLTTFQYVANDRILTHQTSDITPSGDLSDDVIHVGQVTIQKESTVSVDEKRAAAVRRGDEDSLAKGLDRLSRNNCPPFICGSHEFLALRIHGFDELTYPCRMFFHKPE